MRTMAYATLIAFCLLSVDPPTEDISPVNKQCASDTESSDEGTSEDPDVVIENSCKNEESQNFDSVDDKDKSTGPRLDGSPEFQYEWTPACDINTPDSGDWVDCPGVHTCGSVGSRKWTLWVRESPDESWQPVETVCRSNEPPVREEPELKPQVTDSVVLRAVRRIGLPSAEIQVQPEGATLVNLRTIFYTEPARMERSVTLLGVEVDIVAEGVEYRWRHGDGTEQVTESPGAPYPEMDVTHTFTDAHVTVGPQVDVTYRVQWRVGEGSWRTLDETLTATGPRTDLKIKEATALLTDPYK